MNWWKDSNYDIGSPHNILFFSITREVNMLVDNPIYTCQYDFEKANWKSLNKDILIEQNNKEFQWSLTEITKEALELEAEKLQKLILNIIKKHIPKKKFYEKSKS